MLWFQPLTERDEHGRTLDKTDKGHHVLLETNLNADGTNEANLIPAKGGGVPVPRGTETDEAGETDRDDGQVPRTTGADEMDLNARRPTLTLYLTALETCHIALTTDLMGGTDETDETDEMDETDHVGQVNETDLNSGGPSIVLNLIPLALNLIPLALNLTPLETNLTALALATNLNAAPVLNLNTVAVAKTDLPVLHDRGATEGRLRSTRTFSYGG